MTPEHLFKSDTDGALYDTRTPDWSKRPALRAVFKRHSPEIKSTADLKAALRAGPYAWPGGYPVFFMTSDGAALSFGAVRKELRNVLASISQKQNDGWRVVALDVNYENTELYCDHSGDLIPSAYNADGDCVDAPTETA